MGSFQDESFPPFQISCPFSKLSLFGAGVGTYQLYQLYPLLWISSLSKNKLQPRESRIPRSAVFRTLIFCLDENMTKAWAAGWWLVSSELGTRLGETMPIQFTVEAPVVNRYWYLSYLAPEIFPTRFIGTIGTLGPWGIMILQPDEVILIEIVVPKKLMATYCNMYYMYRTLKLDLFGELFSWGLPERVLFWILMVWPFKRWGHSCFPCESLRGSVFLKQADCHLLGVSWWSNEQDMTIVSLHRPPGEQVEWSPNKACVYVQEFW